ncbi:primary active transporter [Lithospermum erythrorhizon]|uniref:GrpE protein homolog n=1 Tax=Lithospermum erythrorhizon TaxID=34254 RepID=A0AAV3P6A2_LITER
MVAFILLIISVSSSNIILMNKPNNRREDESTYENVSSLSTSNLMSILQVYKEAVLIGDVTTTSEIEALICTVEKEKKQLVQKVSAMSVDISSWKEKCIRLQADFDNFRKRSEREGLRVRSNAKGEVIESLLPMVDNFDRARQQLKLETEKEKSINASYLGIYKQLVEIMKSLQVAVVPTVGKPFDPSIHEAIAREESQEFKEGIVIQEVRRGFVLGDRVLRPATVKVSSGPGVKKKGASSNNSLEQSSTVSSL